MLWGLMTFYIPWLERDKFLADWREFVKAGNTSNKTLGDAAFDYLKLAGFSGELGAYVAQLRKLDGQAARDWLFKHSDDY